MNYPERNRELEIYIDEELDGSYKWEWIHLKQKCKSLELEDYYQLYKLRLYMSYLCIFILLQVALLFSHMVLLMIAVTDLSNVLFDILVYVLLGGVFWAIVYINFHEDFIKNNKKVVHFTSWLAVLTIVIIDIGVTIYHGIKEDNTLHTSYAAYSIFVIYLFMPLPNYMPPLTLGLSVTAMYFFFHAMFVWRVFTESSGYFDVTSLFTEFLFFLYCNLLGLFFRIVQEVAIRTTFLDRRQYIEESLLFRFARDQEKTLLLSIIPPQIANRIEQDVKVRIERLKKQGQRRHTNIGEGRKLFIEPHTDVSILYADVVNYTYLTTTLDVKTLVETLHDLFVKFDMGAQEFNVLRIKFLGDCYYCVSGVPIPNEDHAKCCVDLGLRMIKDIRDVREKRGLNVDMRIGVHSGNILSGVIGACKWQFDIWSKDVDIASKLEATGMAGRVHVSEQTLQLLDGDYIYEDGTEASREDSVLKKYGIKSYLIKLPRLSLGGEDGSLVKMKSSSDQTGTTFVRQTVYEHDDVRTQAKAEMRKELDRIPVGKLRGAALCFKRTPRLSQDEIEEENFRRNISNFCLFFRDWHWELQYLKELDVMLKYSILAGASVFLFIFIINVTTNDDKGSTMMWCLFLIFFVIISFYVFLAWYREIWKICFDRLRSAKPRSKISSCFYRISENMQANVILRITIYLSLMLALSVCALCVLFDCKRFQIENEEVDIQLFEDGVHRKKCFFPWTVTYFMILTLAIGFVFTRIPLFLKTTVCLIITVAYVVVVIFEFDFIYEKSTPTNVGLYADYSHAYVIIAIFAIFVLMACQVEFITKMDYNWKRQLLKKQYEAQVTNESIKVLINNILPAHVADIYISKKIKNELYYEEYDNVAVMFASIKNFDTEKVGLRVLNEIICDFDDVLNSYTGSLKIEKIKVAGWTYMAACGLDVTRSERYEQSGSGSRGIIRRSNEEGPFRPSYEDQPSLPLRNYDSYDSPSDSGGRKTDSQLSGEGPSQSAPQLNNVVYVMAQFALDLMRTMQAFNLENLQVVDDSSTSDYGLLRIGISHGKIMAGVVGSSKPHYDIWGNAVNMASRMDSTGFPGVIQVTQETAFVLRTFNIQCNYRGMTYVKGRGQIPTYFIGIDKDIHFIENSATDLRKRRN